MNQTHYLIVDDDDDHAALISRGLLKGSAGCLVDRVADGWAAITFLQNPENPRPHVVLLDLNLPGLSGLEVLRLLKSDKDLRSIPVVMLTTSGAESDRAAAYHAHVNSYLVKPIDFIAFQSTVREMSHYWGEINQSA